MGILRSADGSSRLHGSSGNTASLSIISPGAHLVGDVRAEGTIRVEGEVEGSLHVHGQVLVAPGGVVAGDILAAHVIVGGEVRGEINADDMTELHAGGSVAGNIVTPRIAVADGAKFNGRLHTAKPEAARRKPLASDVPPAPSLVDEPPALGKEFRSAS
jgi:cytoskeletal protein CcmA (bactofilin family)